MIEKAISEQVRDLRARKNEALKKAWKRKPDPGTLDGAKRRILIRLRKA